MIFAFRELLTYKGGSYSLIEIEENSEDPDSIKYPRMIGLRRFYEYTCKSCNDIYRDIYRDIRSISMRNGMFCCFCSSKIISKSLQYHKNLDIKRNIYTKILPKLHQEIQEFGMRPNRIYQTQLFEYYIFMDLKSLK